MGKLSLSELKLSEQIRASLDEISFSFPIDHWANEVAALEARLSKMEDVLRWYGEKAEAMKRYSEAKPPMTTAMTAVVTELSLDGGNRADALAEGEA